MILIWPYILETYPVPNDKPIAGVMTHIYRYGSRDFTALDDDDAQERAQRLLADEFGNDWAEHLGAVVLRRCIVPPNRLVARLA